MHPSNLFLENSYLIDNTMSVRMVSKSANERNDNDSFETDDGSKGSAASSSNGGVDSHATNSSVQISTQLLIGSKKRIEEASLAADELERLEAKRAYNRECSSRARQRGKHLIAQLEKQIKDLHDDKTELRRTTATMEKRLKQLQRENELLLDMQQVGQYGGTLVEQMLQNGAMQFPQTQFPFAQGERSSDYTSAATMATNRGYFY